MKPCRHRLSFNASYRCHHRGWLFGLCVEHFLELFSWEWRRWSFYGEVDLSNINRPYMQIDEDRPREWVAFSYGNANSDPVFSVQIPLRRGST